MIKAIVVDDEKSGRETLGFLIENYFSKKIHVVSMATNLNEAVEQIEKYQPQVVFLDMQMPNENGLNIMNKFSLINFEIIVTTAHRKYGVEAIESGVFGYLLKPIDIDELDITINKLILKIKEK